MNSLKNPFPLDVSSVAAVPTGPQEESGGGAATDAPRAYEALCLDLIGRLEGLVAEAMDHRRLGQYGDAAAAGKEILLTILDFAEENLPSGALKEVQDRVAEAYEKSKQVDSLVATQSWRAVRRVLGKVTAAPSEVAEAHRALGEAITVVVITAVAGGGDRFQAGSDLAKQMAHSLKLFIDGLRTEW